MIISIKHKDTEIVIEENLSDKDKHVTMRYADQNKYLQVVICDQIKKLQEIKTNP